MPYVTAARGRALAFMTLAAATPAWAFVEGTAPVPYKAFTLNGDAQAIGNTLMGQVTFECTTPGSPVNDSMLDPTLTVADVTGFPAGGTVVGAYLYWAASAPAGSSVGDFTATFTTANGIDHFVTADDCFVITPPDPTGVLGSFYGCYADVTSIVRANPSAIVPGEGATYNGTYNVRDVEARPGNQCPARGGTDIYVAARFAGWSMVLVWGSPPTSGNFRNVVLYNMFLGLDEIQNSVFGAGSSGVPAPYTLDGFVVADPPIAEITWFALEGDAPYGCPPEAPVNGTCVSADYVEVNGTRVGTTGNPPNNIFNSTVPDPNGLVSFSGVDIDRIPIGNLLAPGDTSLTIRPGSGDGNPSGPVAASNNNGEFFILSYALLTIDTVAPDWSTSSKGVTPDRVTVGSDVTFRSWVTNTGRLDATHVVFRDTLAANLELVPGTLRIDGVLQPSLEPADRRTFVIDLGTVPFFQGGNTRAIEFNARVSSGTPGSPVCNSFTITSDQTPVPISFGTSPCAVIEGVTLTAPSLVLTDVNGGDVVPGDRVRYTVTLTNVGSTEARNVRFVADLGPYLKNLSVVSLPFGATNSSTPTGGANGTGQVDIQNISIPGAFGVQIIFEAVVFSEAEFIAAGVPVNQIHGQVSSMQGAVSAPFLTEPLLTDHTSPAQPPAEPTSFTVSYQADLSTSDKVITDENGGRTEPGDPILLTIHVRNTGPRTVNATLSDLLPPYLAGAALVSAPAGVTLTFVPATGRWLLSGTFASAPGSVIQIVVRANVVPTAPHGATLTNVAQLTAPELPSALTLTSNTLTIFAVVDLSTSSKAGADLSGGALNPGDTLRYTITVTNSGSRLATGVVVSDVLDPNLVFVSASGGGIYDAATRTITWNVGTVAARSQVTRTFDARVAAGALHGVTISNAARIASAEVAAVTTNTVMFTVSAPPSFSTSTEDVTGDASGVVRPGDLLDFTIVVRNSGIGAATGVRVSNALVNLVPVLVGQGGVESGGAITWNVGTVAAGESATLTFRARVASPLADGTVITSQAFIESTQTQSAVGTDWPRTAAPGDPVRLTVRASGDYSGTTKTFADLNGGETLPGERVRFEITVTNSGDSVGTVTVSDPISPCLDQVDASGSGGVVGGGTITWTLAGVAAGAPRTVSFEARVAPGTPNGTVCSNQATVTASDGPAALSDDPFTAAADDPTRFTVVSRPLLDAQKTVAHLLDADTDGAFSPGDRVRYSIVIRNTGTEAASSVSVTDPLPAHLVSPLAGQGGTIAGSTASWTVASLAAGASVTLTLDADIERPLDGGTVISNQARVREASTDFFSDDPSTAQARDPTRFTVQAAPRLTLSKIAADEDSDGVYRPNGVVVYTLTLGNAGNAVSHSTVLSDALEGNLTYLSDSAGGVYDAGTRTVRWTVGALAPGEMRVIRLRARIASPLDNGTLVSNQAQASSAQVVAPVLSDDPATLAVGDPTVITVVSGPDLSLSTKAVSDPSGTPVRPGDLLDYTIVVRNQGDAVARNVVVRDPVDGRLAVALPVGQGGQLLPGNVVQWTPATTPVLAAVAPGAAVTLTFTARVARPLPNGTVIDNQATLTADNIAAAARTDDPATTAFGDATRVTIVSAPDLSLTQKIYAAPAGGAYRPGQTVPYTIILKNQGDAEATDVVVTDVLDPNLAFVSASAGGAFDPATRTVRWTVPRVGLTPQSDVLLTLHARIALPLDDGTVISNQASVAGPGFSAVLSDDPSTVANDDPTRLTVRAAPVLGVTKTVSDLNGGAVEPEDTLEWTITIKNTGDMVAHDVRVLDTVAPELDQVSQPFLPGTRDIAFGPVDVDLSPGGERSFTFRARVAPLTPDGTMIANQARVTSREVPGPMLSDDPAAPGAADPTRVTVQAAPVLALTKRVTDLDGGLVRPGDVLEYFITVANTGTGIASGVQVDDVLDPNLAFVSADNGGVFSGALVRWGLPSILPKAAPVALRFRARIRSTARDGTVLSNQASAVASGLGQPALSDDPDTPAPNDPTLITVRFPDLGDSTKTVLDENGGEAEPGDVVSYVIRVVNTGSVAATGVTVTDALDSHLMDPAAPGATWAGGVATWTVGELAPGQSAELRLRATIRPLARNGTVVSNQATIRYAESALPTLTDDPTTPAVDDPASLVVHAAPELGASTKEVEDLNGGRAAPGDALRYRITVRNTGNTWASDVLVTDPLPQELVDVAFVTSGTRVGNELLWRIPRIDPGQSVDLIFTARIGAPLPDGTAILNQALLECAEGVSSLTDDPTTPAPGDPTVVRVFSRPGLTASVKTAEDLNGGALEPGDEILYTIRVRNNGTEDARGTVLVDPPPPGTRYVPGSTTLNGAFVPDPADGSAPLAAGLSVRSERSGTPPGLVRVSDGVLPHDEDAVVQFRVRVERDVLGGTAIVNQGLVASDSTAPVGTDDPSTPSQGDPTVLVVGSAVRIGDATKIWTLVTDRNTPNVPEPGDVIEYVILVPSTGNVPAAGVVVEDAIPEGAAYVPGSLTLGGAPLTDAADGDAGELVSEGAGAVRVRVGEIAPRQSAEVRFRVQIEAGPVISNQALVTADGGIAEPTDYDLSIPGDQPTVTPVGALPVIDLSGSSKTVRDLDGGIVERGDVLAYEIVLYNAGNADATSVSVEDALPAFVRAVEGSYQGPGAATFEPPPAGAFGAGLLRVEGVTVKAGAQASLRFQVRVAADAPLGARIANTARVRGPVSDFDVGPAEVVVGVALGQGGYAGRVFQPLGEDARRRGAALGWQPGDRAFADWQVVVRALKAEGSDLVPGEVVRTAITDAHGDYRVLGLPPGEYELSFRTPAGAEMGRVLGARAERCVSPPAETCEPISRAVEAGRIKNVDGLIDPSGVVYRSADGSPVQGALVALLYDDEELGATPPACDPDRSPITRVFVPELGREANRPVPPACLAPGQQFQRTPVDGLYRFDVFPAPAPVRYRLEVSPPSARLVFPSATRPPEDGFAPPGEVVPEEVPDASRPAFYFLRFAIATAADEVTNNHIPLDGLDSLLKLRKTASRATAAAGELVPYHVTVQNTSSQDFLVRPDGTGGVRLVDAPPSGLMLVKGVARVSRRLPDGRRLCPRESEGADCPSGRADPVSLGAGRLMTFGPYDLRAGETLELAYTLLVGGFAEKGDVENRAVLQVDGVEVGPAARAIVRIVEDTLLDQTSVIGKVFCDEDGDGVQGALDVGLAAVRIWTDTGDFAESDVRGKWHAFALSPGVHLFKLDERTLPPGTTVRGDPARVLWLTPGLDTRLNYALACKLDLLARPKVTYKPKPAPPPLPPPPPPPPRPPPVPAPVTISGDADEPSLFLDGAVVAGVGAPGLFISESDAAGGEPPRTGAPPPNLRAGPAGLSAPAAFWPSVPPEAAVAGWRLEVATADEAKPVAALGGAGAPPEVVLWDGRGEDFTSAVLAGHTYRARLWLEGTDGVMVSSAWTPFGVALPRGPGRKIELAQDGLLFGERDAKPTAALQRWVKEIAPELKDDPTKPIVVEVYVDSSYGAAAARVLTQRRAEAVKELLVAQGIDAARITPRGEGDANPVVPNIGARAKLRNRRVVVRSEAAGAPPVVSIAPLRPRAEVDGAEVALAPDGSFRAQVALPEAGREVRALAEAPDGRAVALRRSIVPRLVDADRASVEPAPLLVVVGLQERGSSATAGGRTGAWVEVGGVRRGLSLLDLTARLAPRLEQDVFVVEGEALTQPVTFELGHGGEVARWSVWIADDRGRQRRALHGFGAPPARVEWSGLDERKRLALPPGRYTYWLMAEDAAGNRGWSAPGTLASVGGRGWDEAIPSAELFLGATDRPAPKAKERLRPLVERMRPGEGGPKVQVVVHTDNARGAETLSQKRAEAVASLLAALGVDRARIETLGKGGSEPLVPNLSPKNRQKNHRVVVSALAPLAPPPSPALPVEEKVLVEGALARRDADGVYRGVAATGNELVRVEVELADGRRAMYRVPRPVEAPSARGREGTELTGTPAPATVDADFFAMAEAAVQDPPAAPVAAASRIRPTASPLAAHADARTDRGIVAAQADAVTEPPRDVPAGRLEVRLPARGTLHTRWIGVSGWTDPQNRLTINGEPVEVDNSGRFLHGVKLPRGRSVIALRTVDPEGNVGALDREVEVAPGGLFLLAMGNGEIGGSGARLEGVGDRAELGIRDGGVVDDGPIFVQGRAALTANGEWAEEGGFFQEYRLTANIDTARRDDPVLFRELYDPNLRYPVWGDSGEFLQGAPASGPVYMKLEADRSTLLVGSLRTKLGDGELLRYDRALYGGDLHFDKNLGPGRTQLGGFVAQAGDRERHAHVELRGTGGSLYYLRDRAVVEGSERIRMVVRDEVSGVELSSTPMVRNVDYVIRYPEGLVVFKSPIPSVSGSSYLANLNPTNPLAGNPVFIVVDYQFRDLSGAGPMSFGVRANQSLFGELVSVGGAYARQDRGPGGEPAYTLWGVTLGSKLTPRTGLTAEFGRSVASSALNFLSVDGGLTYGPLGASCAGPAQCGFSGNALRLTLTGDLRDFTQAARAEPADGASDRLLADAASERGALWGTAYFGFQDRGFVSDGSALERGQLKGGVLSRYTLTPDDQLSLRFDAVRSDLDALANFADVAQAGTPTKRVARYMTALRWRHKQGPWAFTGEAGNILTTDSRFADKVGVNNSLAGRFDYVFDERWSAYAQQEGIVGGGEGHLFPEWSSRLTTTVGGAYKLDERLSLTLAESVRWNGENATLLGLRARLSDTARVHVSERLRLYEGEYTLASIVGGEKELLGGSRVYGEYEVEASAQGALNKAIVGLDNRWEPVKGLKLTLGYERAAVLNGPRTLPAAGGGGASPGVTLGSLDGIGFFRNQGGSPAGAFYPGTIRRDTGTASAEYLASREFKASARLELRVDNADDALAGVVPGVGDRIQFLTGSAIEGKWTDDLTLFARFALATTENQTRDVTDARWVEFTLGTAYRPVQYDTFAVLAKYSRVLDLRPLDLAVGLHDKAVSDVVSLSPSFETPFNLGIALKLAWKVSALSADGLPEATAHTFLSVNRFDFHVLPELDLTAEYRLRWVGLPEAHGGGRELLHGLVGEVAYRPARYVRIGIGYDLSRVADDELAREGQTDGGLFVRVTGIY